MSAITIDAALHLGAQYRELIKVANNPLLPDSIRDPARQQTEEFERAPWDVLIPCIICGETGPTDFEMSNIAQWTDRPRGLCASCDGKATRRVEEEEEL